MKRNKKCIFEEDHEKMKERGTIECYGCNLKLNLNYLERVKVEAENVPLWKKQKILDMLNEGKNIGQARQEVDLDLGVVCEIITQNIGNYQYLRRNAQ